MHPGNWPPALHLMPLGVALGVVTAAACGDPTASRDVPDIAGAWAYSETVTHESARTCSRVGTLSFEQEEETLVGSYSRSTSCAEPGAAPSAGTEAGTIQRGQAVEGGVRFELGDCQYRGDVAEDESDRISGTVLCASPLAATDVASGSWVAERLTESTS